jgi:hypothetical protein
MAEVKLMGDKILIDKGIIDGQKVYITLSREEPIQFNGKMARVSYFKPGMPNLLIYKITDNEGKILEKALTQEELAMVQKVTGGRKTRKSRKSRKSRKTRRYRRV